MNINTNSNAMLSNMQNMIAKAQMQTPGISQPNMGNIETRQVTQTNGSDFASMLKSAVDNVNGLQKHSKALQTAVEMGDRSVSISDAMIASQKSSVAFSATVEVRNKFVEAYKEIMSMPV